jgi:enoyl-CoA hydratase
VKHFWWPFPDINCRLGYIRSRDELLHVGLLSPPVHCVHGLGPQAWLARIASQMSALSRYLAFSIVRSLARRGWVSSWSQNDFRSLSSSATSRIQRELDHISVDVDEKHGVATLELTRHSKLNALSRGMSRDLAHAVSLLDEDEDVLAIVLTGGPRAFAAGADVEGLAAPASSDSGEIDADIDASGGGPGAEAESWMEEIARAKTPIVAAVDGFALGPGCGLALVSDIVIAGETAVFGIPDVQLGRVPSWGVTQRLTRAVGRAKAMEMALTGRQMTATEAEGAGLVSRVAPAGGAVEEAVSVARVIARYSRPVVRAVKECVHFGAAVGLEEGLKFEKRVVAEARTLWDNEEGVRAFAAKREPKWKHR